MLHTRTKRSLLWFIFLLIIVVTVLIPMYFHFMQFNDEKLEDKQPDVESSKEDERINEMIEKLDGERIRSDMLWKRLQVLKNGDFKLVRDKSSDEKKLKETNENSDEKKLKEESRNSDEKKLNEASSVEKKLKESNEHSDEMKLKEEHRNSDDKQLKEIKENSNEKKLKEEITNSDQKKLKETNENLDEMKLKEEHKNSDAKKLKEMNQKSDDKQLKETKENSDEKKLKEESRNSDDKRLNEVSSVEKKLKESNENSDEKKLKEIDEKSDEKRLKEINENSNEKKLKEENKSSDEKKPKETNENSEKLKEEHKNSDEKKLKEEDKNSDEKKLKEMNQKSDDKQLKETKENSDEKKLKEANENSDEKKLKETNKGSDDKQLKETKENSNEKKLEEEITNSDQKKLKETNENSDEKKLKTEKIKKDKSSLKAQKVACEIPQLNPFHELAMAQMKDVLPLKCARKYFSSLKNSYLNVTVKGIYDAYIQYIQRPFQNDFDVKYSNKIMLSKNYKKSKLAKGRVGCIVNERNDILAVKSQVKGQNHREIYLASKINCVHEHFWFLSANGRIEYYLDDFCININRTLSSSEFIATKCNEDADKFNLNEDGTIRDTKSKHHLTARENKIVATVNTSSDSRWKLLESSLQDIDDKYKITEDFIKVTIIKDRKVHEEYHAEVVEKPQLLDQAQKSSSKANLPYGVAFFLIDSQSNSNVQRKMPKTYDILKNDKNTVIFNGHTIVGDGTTPQLCAIFAGELEESLPESRRGFKDAQPVDRWPFLFKQFRERGYLTLFSEDEAMYGSFNYRLHGFKEQPTDHYARPFWMSTHIDYYREGECVGDTPVFQKNLDYSLSFFDRYKGVPKLSLTAISTICHNDVNRIQNADKGVSDILKRMKESGSLDDTIVVIFGDHGARLSGFRETMTGKMEERLPFLSITLPSKMTSKYPNLLNALKHNSNILTSHFDIHATLKHMLTYPETPDVKKGQSLFTLINATTRDCKSAGIKEHWCPCLQFKVLNTTDDLVIKSAKAIVEYINKNITHAVPEGKRLCAELNLDSIKRAGKRIPNKLVRTFEQTSPNAKCVECGLVLGKEKANDKEPTILEIVFSVSPSGGVFEASVSINDDLVIVNPNISRINKYGNQPKCIQDKYPFLRKYCLCK